MSGYKDYLSEEMQGAIETRTPSKKTRLSQFRHGGYHSSMDEFFTAGKKSYGVRNVDVAQLGKYSNTGRGGNPRFSTAEFFGKTFMSNGGEVTVYNNPGNLEKGQGYAGETGNTYADDRERPFVIFDSPEMGVRALAMDLQTKIKRHEGDVDKIIAQFAPDNENDTKKYQEFVKQKLKKDKVTNKDLKFLVQAIIEKENKPEVADYYLDNPDIIKKGLAMSYFQLPKGISLEQAINEISAKESTLKKVLKNRKPFRYGGGADASKSDFGGGGSSSSSSSSGGGSNKDGSKDDTKGGNRPTMADIAGPTTSSTPSTDNKTQGGGADMGTVSTTPTPAEQETKTKANKTREKIRAAFDNYVTPSVAQQAYSFFDTLNPLSPRTQIDLEQNTMTNIQAVKAVNTPIGTVTFDRTTVRDLPLDKQGLLNPDTEYGANITGSYKGVDYGARIDDTGDIAGGFTTDLGPGTLTGSGYYDGSDDYGGSVSYGISFKRGGLLDRSRKK